MPTPAGTPKASGKLLKSSESPEDIHVYKQGKHRQYHERYVDKFPDKAYDQLAPDMCGGRDRKRMHQIALICKEILPEPQDAQINPGD